MAALDAIAITHFHLDHWGDLVPWVWGAMYRWAGVAIDNRPDLWVHQGGRDVLEDFGERFGFSDMFDRVFTVHEYAPEEPFMAAGFEVTADATSALHPRDVRVQALAGRRVDRLLGRQRPERAIGGARA